MGYSRVTRITESERKLLESEYADEKLESRVIDSDMADVYQSLDGNGQQPVYLSDGVWLYPDGSVRHDR
ncbi:hypothetical protein [Anaerobiospirillum succiniciproducens]|uniref:hypothetical protein n=1 Tax=Anaerobiospirillum succiniciproducens TaxID=13335 RepID=UPI000403BC2D|nr:hypothetical protein [Anaerobiospirillum succiniciproducens]